MEKKISEISNILFLIFGKKVRCPGSIRKMAGKILKNKGADACKEFLLSKKEEILTYVKAPKVPVKCNIIAQSRPFEEWEIVKASKVIQEFVYNSKKSDVDSWSNKSCWEKGLGAGTKQEINKWLSLNNLNFKYCDVQGLNLIIKNAINIYNGVLLKVDNLNVKNKEKHDKLAGQGLTNQPLITKLAIDNIGFLVEKPGVNNNIFCYQGVSPVPVDFKKKKHKLVIDSLSLKYSFDPKEKIPVIGDRLGIKEGRPGYIPPHDRDEAFKTKHFNQATVNTNKKRIRSYPKSNNKLLLILFIEEDWILIDARGLLRNVYYRKLVKPGTVNLIDLLGKFTGDPVIDPKRLLITFQYKDGVLHTETLKPFSYKKAPDFIKNHLPANLISIDLGQNNFVAARHSVLSKDFDNETKVSFEKNLVLPDEIIKLYYKIREKHDEVEEEIKYSALEKLSVEEREEFNQINNFNSNNLKYEICKKFSLDFNQINWSKMTNNTFFIADAFLSNSGDKSEVYFKTKDKKTKKEKEIKRNDLNIFNLLKRKVSENVREKYNQFLWEIKRDYIKYKKLSQRKKELAKRSVNYIIKSCENCSYQTIINIENLVKKNNFFGGSGKRSIGFENFSISKKENRWFINYLHKAFEDLAQDKGIPVILSHPAYTSQTCPKCSCCNSGNRNGENFKCLRCGESCNADINVATFNLEKIALTGQAMSKPDIDRERLSGSKNMPRPRKTKSL